MPLQESSIFSTSLTATTPINLINLINLINNLIDPMMEMIDPMMEMINQMEMINPLPHHPRRQRRRTVVMSIPIRLKRHWLWLIHWDQRTTP